MAKIVFLQNGWTEQLGLMSLSSYLKEKGHQCDLFVENGEDIVKLAISSKPHIIGFSAVTMQRQWILDVAKKIKQKSDIPIIIGGPDPTFFPDILKEECIDIICRGEGELSLCKLMDSLDKGSIKEDIENLYIKKNGKIYQNPIRPLISNLDEFPPPDRELYYKYSYFRKYPVKRVQASRGCPYKCTYCFNLAYLKLYEGGGKYVRFRSPEKVIEEIKDIRDKYGFKTLIFNDDVFTINKKWLYSLLEKYQKEIKKPFTCLTTANLINEDVVKKLKEAGCYAIWFGIETGNEKIRKELLKKNITNEQILKTTQLCKKTGIITRSTNMLGLPGETLENSFETLDLNIQAKVDVAWCSLFLPYPGTELRKIALENGLIDENKKETFSYFSGTILKQKDIKKISNLQKLFPLTVKFPFLRPVIKILISLPSNFIFNFIFLVSFAYIFAKSHNLNLVEAVWWHARNVKKFF